MDSNLFFISEGNKWKGKSGIYCIEQEALSNKLGKRLFKVGYARNSIWTRISDYRSAYGGIPFKIYCLIQIPAGVFGKRSGYTLLNEQRLHKQLSEDGKGAGANEWYFDLNHIMDIMYSLYIELVGTIDSAKKWEVYFYDAKREYNILKVIDEKEIKSKLYDGLTYGEKVLRNAKQKYGQDALQPK
jgi:hypothetical protein